MGTYDHKQVIADYENGTLTPEMAVGHGLQHIAILYEGQTAATVSCSQLRSKVDTLENRVTALQAMVNHLTALVEKFLPKRKGRTSGQSQTDQPEPSGRSTLQPAHGAGYWS